MVVCSVVVRSLVVCVDVAGGKMHGGCNASGYRGKGHAALRHTAGGSTGNKNLAKVLDRVLVRVQLGRKDKPVEDGGRERRDKVLLARDLGTQVEGVRFLCDGPAVGGDGEGTFLGAADEELRVEVGNVDQRKVGEIEVLLGLESAALEEELVALGIHGSDIRGLDDAKPDDKGGPVWACQIKGLLVAPDERVGREESQGAGLCLEQRLGQRVGVLDVQDRREERDHGGIVAGGCGRAEVERVGQDPAQEERRRRARDGLVERHKRVRNDGAGRAPRADVHVDGEIRAQRRRLQRMVVDDPHHLFRIHPLVHLRGLAVVHQDHLDLFPLSPRRIGNLLKRRRKRDPKLGQRILGLCVDVGRTSRNPPKQLCPSHR